MLARPNRLTRGADYKGVVRRGRRRAATHLVSYTRPACPGSGQRFGFIVSRQVGSAVVRNTVRRRLKAACAQLRPNIAADVDVVLRALPSSARADYEALRADVVRTVCKVQS